MKDISYYRRLPRFEYLAPGSVEEACSLLQKYKGKARVVAGGTIVIHRMKERIGVRKYLVGLKGIAGLAAITSDRSGGLKIGAMASLQSIADSPVVREKFETLAVACGRLGTPQIRNMGTIGGNVGCKLATAETVPALIALRAEVKVASASGEKTIVIEDLYKELEETDLVSQIHVQTPAPGTKGGYQKYAIRKGIDYATVSTAVMLTSTNGICQDIKIALGGVALPSMRAGKAEELVKGQKKTESVIAQAAQAASKDAKIASDIFFSAEYKKELLKILVARAIKQAWEA